MSTDPQPHPYRRCFVSGNDPATTARLVEMVRALGIEAASTDQIRVGQTITQEVVRLITDADFIAVVITDRAQAFVAYELGLAQGLGKPAFVVFVGGQALDLASAYMVSIADDREIESVADDLERFVRHAKRPGTPPSRGEPAPAQPLDWARDRLKALRAENGPDRYRDFEVLCAEIFRAADAEVALVGDDRTVGADLVVWLNDIAFELGGPTLVECKFYGGGVGSVIKNSEATVRSIEAVMDRSDAKLALLVYDHDRLKAPPSLHETPRVLSLAIEDVIQAVEHGNLDKMILKRRERALFAGRPQ
ncbi:restriction endonuclease [Aurantiacibacter flavus]|uniref:Restriction endonuclease n=1 Tax=Aurantiacibacter flavus TaxID=3145232 RepID=A0ABV0CWS9_9SPHN